MIQLRKFIFDFICFDNKKGIAHKKIFLYLFDYVLPVTYWESRLSALEYRRHIPKKEILRKQDTSASVPPSLLILEKHTPPKIACYILNFHKLLGFFHPFKRTTWGESPLKLHVFSKRYTANTPHLKKSHRFLADMTVVFFSAIGGQYFQM